MFETELWTAAVYPQLICGRFGITMSTGARVLFLNVLSQIKNVKCHILHKVGINGPSFDQSFCLAQGWRRGRKELGCSLLPVQMLTRLKSLRSWAAAFSPLCEEEKLKHSWVKMQPFHMNKDVCCSCSSVWHTSVCLALTLPELVVMNAWGGSPPHMHKKGGFIHAYNYFVSINMINLYLFL